MTTSVPRQVDALATAKRAEGQKVAQKDGLLRIVQGLRRVDTGTYALRIRLAENLGIGTIDINAMAFVGEVDGLTPKDLGKALNITTGSVTAMVDRLDSKGFMVRTPNPTDRRSVLLHLAGAFDHLAVPASGGCVLIDDDVPSADTAAELER